MRIAIHAKVLSERQPVGIGIYVYNLLNAISKIDKENEYVLYSNEPIIQKIRADNFKERILNFPKLWTYIRFPFEFIGNKYDILFVPKEVVPPLKRPKTVIVCYDFGRLVDPKDRIAIDAKIHFWIATHFALKTADKIIAISESTKKKIINTCKIAPEKVIVTHLGYDKEIYKSNYDTDVIDKVKRKYGIRNNYIINISSLLWYRKNLPRLIKAFHICKSKRVINHQLVITGKRGEAYSEIVSLIKSLNLEKDVVLTGYISTEDMPLLLCGADALVFPSLHEGFGLPILEAMACGCPVITSNLSAMPEVVEDAGVLVNPYSEEEIAHTIERVLTDAELRRQMSNMGLIQAKKYSWENTARETLKVFESLK